MSDLASRRCVACEGSAKKIDAADMALLLEKLSDRWTVDNDHQRLHADFIFRNYYQTSAFVNAVAWIAHCENHHPEIAFGYKTCRITWWTHAVDGLTENDFICAAKVDQLIESG
jgi:4a-hydroxytetrahydrobiopterin dehydratase